MNKNYVKTVDEYAEYKMIKEALMLGGPIEIPGLNFVTATISDDEIIITTESGRIYPLDMKFLTKLADDDDALTPYMINNLNKLFQAALISKADSFLPKKIDVLRQAEGFEIFEPEIDKGGFFANLEEDLALFGMSIEDIAILTGELYDFYTKGHIDNMSPEGLAILRNYLDYWMEIIASTVYIYLQYLNNEAWVEKPIQGQSFDQTNLANNTNVNNTKKQFTLTNEMLTEETVNLLNELKTNSVADQRAKGIQGADYKSNLNLIFNQVQQAAYKAGVRVANPYDYDTGRDVIPTTKTIVFPVLDKGLLIKAIFSPVELKQKTNGSTQVFSLEDEDGFISKDYENIIGIEALANAIKKLI